MRTTLTLDDDVAVLIEQLRKSRGKGLKELVNEGLRAGLQQMTAPSREPKSFRTATVDLGRCLVANVDNVAEVLAVVDGESFR